MKVSVVIPVFNEEHIIEKSIKNLAKELSAYFTDLEILPVNDGSIDKTGHILHTLSLRDKRIRPILHKINLGYGAALKSGIAAAKHDWIFFTDADMQFNVKEITRFLPHTNHFDMIVGKRANRADSLKRKIISSFYNRFVRVLFGLPLQDVDCAFKLMRKSSLSIIDIQSDSFFVSVEVMVKALRNKLRIKELAVTHYPRAKGESKVTFKRILLTIRDLVTLKIKGI